MTRIQDNDIDRPLADYFSHKPGDILTAPDTGNRYEIFAEHRININITSWAELEVGAIHWYPRIDLYGISIGDVGNEDMSYGGYLGGLSVEINLTVELTRIITIDDRIKSPERFSKHQIETTAFLSKADAKQAIKDFLKEYDNQLEGWSHDYDVDENGWPKEKA